MSASIKICGLNSEAAVKAVIAAGADYAGFVYFPKSPRHITLERAHELKALLPASIPAVSVLVDPDDAMLEQVEKIFAPEFIQLHGGESVERIREIRKRFPNFKIIKAVAVRNATDIEAARRYEGEADMLMYDAKVSILSFRERGGASRGEGGPHPNFLPEGEENFLPGGNGIAFDWTLLKGHASFYPWFLSGGLNPKNVAEAIRISGATMVDVSSGVESAPGVKDAKLIEAFLNATKS